MAYRQERLGSYMKKVKSVASRASWKFEDKCKERSSKRFLEVAWKSSVFLRERHYTPPTTPTPPHPTPPKKNAIARVWVSHPLAHTWQMENSQFLVIISKKKSIAGGLIILYINLQPNRPWPWWPGSQLPPIHGAWYPEHSRNLSVGFWTDFLVLLKSNHTPPPFPSKNPKMACIILLTLVNVPP